MKLVISTLPMTPLAKVKAHHYPVDGNAAIEYEGAVRYPVNAVLAKTLRRGDEVKIVLVATTGANSAFDENRAAFMDEIAGINAEIGANLSFETVEIPFLPTKKTFNTLLLDLTAKIPQGARVYADMTFGSKPAVFPLFCALAFAENFCDAAIEYIVYGKVEFNRETGQAEAPALFDVTSLYYLFRLMGTINAPDAESAAQILKDFFAV